MSFKIGDIVRILSADFDTECGFKVGDLGVIKGLPDSIGTYGVLSINEEYNDLWDSNVPERGHSYYEEEIEHVRIRNTRLARKIHKNNIHSEDEKWIYLLR
jgi:hypothetical protein